MARQVAHPSGILAVTEHRERTARPHNTQHHLLRCVCVCLCGVCLRVSSVSPLDTAAGRHRRSKGDNSSFRRPQGTQLNTERPGVEKRVGLRCFETTIPTRHTGCGFVTQRQYRPHRRINEEQEDYTPVCPGEWTWI